MKQLLSHKKSSNPEQRSEFFIGLSVILGLAVVIGVIVLFAYSSMPKIVHQPANACDLFTKEEAISLLGENTLLTGSRTPVIDGDVATSRCGYTDGNANTDKAIVAAVVVRSGINNEGVVQNKKEFTDGRPSSDTEVVEGVGEAAYFNQQLGQLNVIDDKNWIILSMGVGSEPESNTLEDATRLAEKVLN